MKGKINDVVITKLNKIPDERGCIMHMLRVDAPNFQKFGEIYFSTAYPGVIVDPSFDIFYNPCLSSFNDGKNPWLHLVDVSFNTTSYYKTAVKNNPFAKFNFPQQVIFSCNGTF